MPELILGDLNIDPIIKAQHFLKTAIEIARSDLEKAGAIQAFEICYELSWKTMKRILAYRGIEANSPREVFRLAAREKLIDDLDNWFEFIEKRNLTTHVYNLEIANEIFNFLPKFYHELDKFTSAIRFL
jgi:nucleotidyltransferase substrate binding protein (TIGR01987 family)